MAKLGIVLRRSPEWTLSEIFFDPHDERPIPMTCRIHQVLLALILTTTFPLTACSQEPANDTVAGQLPPCNSKYIKWKVAKLIENSERGVQFNYKVATVGDTEGIVNTHIQGDPIVRDCVTHVDTNRGRFELGYFISFQETRDQYLINIYAFR